MKNLAFLFLAVAFAAFAANGCQLRPSHIVVKDAEKENESDDYPAWKKPELAVTKLSIVPAKVNPGDKVLLHAEVSNIGAGNTRPATLIFSINGSEIKRSQISALKPFEVTLQRYSWSANTPGLHRVRMHLEMGHDSVDWLFSNNFKDATVRVSGEKIPKPDLEFNDVDFRTLQLVPGKPYTIPIVVNNPSFTKIPNIPISFYIDDERVSNDMIRSLAPGERQELRIPWSEVTPGEHLISAKIDLPDEFPNYKQKNIRSWHLVVPDRTVLFSYPQKDKWVSIGPRIINNYWHKGSVGRMNAIAFHPTDTGIIYAGGGWMDCVGPCLYSASGLWRTENGGASWMPLGDKLDSMVIGAIAVDPKHPNIIYTVTGHAIRQPKGAGIFKSTDSGKTWWPFASNKVAGGASRIVVRYPKPNEVLIYAGTDHGVLRYKSNKPSSLTSIFTEWDVIKTGAIRDLVVHPTNPSIVYASIDNEGLYRTNNGVNAKVETSPTNHDWTKLEKGLPAKISRKANQWLTVDILKPIPEILFAGILKPSSDIRFALYRSTDSGDTWETVEQYTADELDSSLYNPYIRIHPASPYPYITVYFGGVSLYKWVGLIDFGVGHGRTLRVYGNGVDMKTLEFHPANSAQYFSLGDQGVYRCEVEQAQMEFDHSIVVHGKKDFKSRDECWHRNNDLRVTQFYDFDVSKTDPNLIIGGTQDTGNILYEGSIDWKWLNRGDGNYSLIDPIKPSVMYDQKQTLESTKRTEDGGHSWVEAHTGLPKGYGSMGYITHDPGQSGILLSIGDQVYYTKNSGKSWIGVGPNDPDFKGPVRRVAIQANRKNWIAGTNTGQLWIWYRRRAGSSWELLFERKHDPASVRSIAFSVSDPDVFYVLFEGGNALERVYRFKMKPIPPVSWSPTNITSNLPPNIKLNVIAGDPHDPFVAYLGTEKGVWRRDMQNDSMIEWRPYNDGLPLTTVVDLLPVPQTMSLVAATKGRGAWSVITSP